MAAKKKVKCSRCFGKGKVNRPLPTFCPSCGGVGWVYVASTEA